MRVALLGKSGTGKTEVATALASLSDFQIIKTGSICRQISRLLFDNEEKASTQKLDDVLTQIDSSIFLRASVRQIEGPNRAIVVDALRFQSDLIIAKELGCRLLRVTAATEVRVARLVARGQKFNLAVDGVHRSEIELDDVPVDFTIDNDGSQEALHAQVLKVLGSI